jgi:endonuclease III
MLMTVRSALARLHTRSVYGSLDLFGTFCGNAKKYINNVIASYHLWSNKGKNINDVIRSLLYKSKGKLHNPLIRLASLEPACEFGTAAL